jgi:hypothetical protein
MTVRITTFSILTLSITTLSITTLSITTLSIMTFSIMTFSITIKCDTQQSIVMLCATNKPSMLNVIMLSVVAPFTNLKQNKYKTG